MKFLLCFALVASVSAVPFLQPKAEHMVNDPNYKLEWTIAEERITFTCTVKTTGYVGLGFNAEAGSMEGAELVIAGVKTDDGSTTVAPPPTTVPTVPSSTDGNGESTTVEPPTTTTVVSTTEEEVETTTVDDTETTTGEGEETTTGEAEETTTGDGEETTTGEGEETTTGEGEETTTVEDGETTTVEDGETTTVEDGETTTVEDGETTTVEDGETTTVEGDGSGDGGNGNPRAVRVVRSASSRQETKYIHVFKSSPDAPIANHGWTLEDATETEDQTIIKISRALTIEEEGRFNFEDKKINVLWSYGEDDDIEHHGNENRGVYAENLINPEHGAGDGGSSAVQASLLSLVMAVLVNRFL